MVTFGEVGVERLFHLVPTIPWYVTNGSEDTVKRPPAQWYTQVTAMSNRSGTSGVWTGGACAVPGGAALRW